MKIKSLLLIALCGFLGSAALWGQTATVEEILSRMEEQVGKAPAQGYSTTLTLKLPIVGEVSSENYVFGDKMKTEIRKDDVHSITWIDGTTKWDYDPAKKEIVISNYTAKTPEEGDDDDDLKFVNAISDGYDGKITKETDEAWYMTFKKSRDNKDKDAPAKEEVVISKKTYLPILVSAKKGIVSIKIADFKLGVSEEDVTFNLDDYPDATVIDNR